MRNPQLPRWLALGALCAALAGCASVPPETDSLPRQDLARAQLAAGIHLAAEGWPAARWWRQYGDVQLDALMERALTAGPSLATAAARIGAARSALAVDRAAGDSGLNLDAQANRQRYSGNGLFPEPIGGSYYSEETVKLDAHYDLDWWGKRRAQIAASLGEVNARRADYAMAEQALTAEVALRYFALQGNWARLANLRQLTQLQDALVADKVKRIAHGLATIDAQRQAEGDASALRQQAALLETQAGREREALRALLGANGGALVDLRARAGTAVAHALPTRLGMELLARRPDLQAARWRIEASLNRIEAARAAFYPDIDLSASFGLDAVKLGKLLESGSRTLFIGPALSLPLFDSGRLEARLGQARQERNEAIADYNQSVFTVVREVAQAGVELQGIEGQIVQQSTAQQASAALLGSAQARFKQGLADRSTTLSAEIAVLKQRDGALQLQSAQFGAEVTLIRALGGGYQADANLAQSTK